MMCRALLCLLLVCFVACKARERATASTEEPASSRDGPSPRGAASVHSTTSASPAPQEKPAPQSSFHRIDGIKPADTKLPGYGRIGDESNAEEGWAPNRGFRIYRPKQPKDPRVLVVFLPGCGSKPDDYEEFLETATNQGYHAIGLDYPNNCGMNDSCETSFDCPGRYRGEVAMADLDKKFAKLEGHPQDAINKRLKALLLHLDVLDPPGKWNEFLYVDGVSPDGIRPRYDKMVFAGHSLGAGYAAFVASRHQVRRVIMISNPADAIDSCSTKGDSCTDPTTKAANWLKSHETPADAYHGLIHRRDEGDNHYHRARACWNAIGVLDKRQHVVEDECKGDCSPHGAPATAKRYRDLWIQMLGTP